MSRTPVAAEGTAGHVRRLIESTFRRSVETINQMTYGHGSVTYKVTCHDEVFIVRTNTDSSAFEGTLGNLDYLHRLGLPVPTVLASDMSQTQVPFAYMVTDAFRGTDLGFVLGSMTRAQQTRLAEQIVEFERMATELPAGSRYGYVPIGATGTENRWSDVVRKDRHPRAPEADHVVAALIDRTLAVVDAETELIDSTPPTCFFDDLTTKNVIVDRGSLQGLVDFDVVCYGDPMYWLSLTNVAVVSDVGEAGYFYLRELKRLWKPNDHEIQRLGLYTALHAAEFLSWDEGPARRQRLLDIARTSLDAHERGAAPSSYVLDFLE